MYIDKQLPYMHFVWGFFPNEILNQLRTISFIGKVHSILHA